MAETVDATETTVLMPFAQLIPPLPSLPLPPLSFPPYPKEGGAFIETATISITARARLDHSSSSPHVLFHFPLLPPFLGTARGQLFWRAAMGYLRVGAQR